ncbi:hypothetical protein [Marinobacter sp.]
MSPETGLELPDVAVGDCVAGAGYSSRPGFPPDTCFLSCHLVACPNVIT